MRYFLFHEIFNDVNCFQTTYLKFLKGKLQKYRKGTTRNIDTKIYLIITIKRIRNNYKIKNY